MLITSGPPIYQNRYGSGCAGTRTTDLSLSGRMLYYWATYDLWLIAMLYCMSERACLLHILCVSAIHYSIIFLFLQCVSTVIIVYIIISPLNLYIYILYNAHWILEFTYILLLVWYVKVSLLTSMVESGNVTMYLDHVIFIHINNNNIDLRSNIQYT